MEGFKLYFKLISQIKNNWFLTLAGYLCAIIQVVTIMAQPIIFAYIIDHVLIEKNTEYLLVLLVISFVCAIITVLLSIVKSGIFRYLEICNTLDMRDVLLNHLRKVNISDIEKMEIGKYQILLGLDTAVLANFLNLIVVELLSNFTMLVISIGILLYMNYIIGMIGIICCIFLFVIPTLFKKPLFKYINHVRTHNEQMGGYLYECIEGSKEIRVLGLENWENKKNSIMYKDLIRASYLESIFKAVSSETSTFVISIIIVFVYWIGSTQILNQALSIGLLVASISYLNTVLSRVQNINNFYGVYQNSLVAMKRIDDFLKTPVEKYYLNNSTMKSNPEAVENKVIEIKDLSIKIKGVSILNKVNLVVEENKKIALIGLSGSGKSSVYKSLLGLMPFTSGSIFINGRDLDKMTREEINSQMGIIFQDSFIFKGTIYENISLGKLGAGYDEVYEAAVNANLKKLVDKLPDGLHTPLNYKGLELSGGERQRIAIARIFLSKPGVLLLDEPTSSLDRITEYEVIDALEKLMKNKTTIMSTHRLEIIRNSDLIYIIDNGKIIDQGNHGQLLLKSDFYQKLVERFQSEEHLILN